jgi:Ca-activated chloride channel family protein
MNARTIVATLVILASLLGLAAPAAADGIIIIDPPPGPPCPEMPPCINCRPIVTCPPISNLTVKYHRVSVTIQDGVATTRVDQVFVNPQPYTIEGTYLFPLPADAAVADFAMWVDGTRVEGKILSREEARAIYDAIVSERLDPALLEYVGRGAVQASIFPIPPGAERRIELEYSQVLSAEGGLVRYAYPLSTEKFSAQPLEEVAITVDIRSQAAMKSLYSPSHRVAVERDGDHHAVVSYEDANVRPETDFELYYSVSEDEIGLNLLSFQEGEEDGFFLLLVAPQVEIDAAQVIAKDVLVVVDTSGSMEGDKMRQAKDALLYILDHLNVEDRFNIISFSTGLTRYASGLRPASDAAEARGFVERLQAVGGTDIQRALLEAMAQADPERPTVLLFLTDGLPTVGVTDVDWILRDVTQAAPENVRLFAFGVGYDVNTLLLDTLAQEHHGASAYVRPDEALDEAVSGFYAKVQTPLLTGLKLEVEGVTVNEVYPDPLPDLFAGSQLVVAGRYRSGGIARITLSGQVNGEERRFTYSDQVFRTGGGESFIPRLWATRAIGHLLTQVRLNGPDEETIDAIVKLSIRYGIVTPYTSYLVQEEDALTQEGQQRLSTELMAAATAPAPAAGAGAVDRSATENALRDATQGYAYAGGGGDPGDSTMKVVGSKTFILRDGVWTDTAFDPSRMKTTRVGFGSDDYFNLLSARPALGPAFALGPRVIVVLDGVAYETVEGDGDPLTLPASATPAPTTTPPRPGDNATATPVVGIPLRPPSSPNNGGLPLGVFAALAGLATLSLTAVVLIRRRA